MWQRSALVLIVDEHSVEKHLQRSKLSPDGNWSQMLLQPCVCQAARMRARDAGSGACFGGSLGPAAAHAQVHKETRKTGMPLHSCARIMHRYAVWITAALRQHRDW